MGRRTITVHISPYIGGLVPETYDFVAHLNEEARRLKTGVSFIALANRILAHGILERALKFANTLGAWQLRRAITDGYIPHRPQPIWETPAIEGEETVLRRGNSKHRNDLRRWERNRPAVAKAEIDAEIERCPLAYYSALRSAILWSYFKPYRPLFWNVKTYWEYGPLGIRQHGGPVRLIVVTPDLALSYLCLWRGFRSPGEQRRLERWGRLYKWSCWSGFRFDDRASSYLAVNETVERKEQKNTYRRFDQKPPAYLYPKHAPERQQFGGNVICLPLRDHAKLERTRATYNEQWPSYLNSRALGRKLREHRSLNIPREVLETRNAMVTNFQHDYKNPHDEVA